MSQIRVRMADYAVARGDATLVTVGLGSCVAIAVHDAATGVGALAHILLPGPQYSRDDANPARFPGTVVPLLVDEMRALGARGPFTVRLVGGASMFRALLASGGINIGERNADAARQACAAAGLRLLAEDTGGEHGRSVYFHLRDGRLQVRSLAVGDREL